VSSPPVSASSGSPSAGETEAADDETPEEFVRRWVEVDREMQNTGDTQEFRSISRNCVPCKGLADQVDRIYAAGGYVRTDGFTIRRLVVGPTQGYQIEVRIWVDSAPTELVEVDGGEIQHLEGGKRIYIITVRKLKKHWNTVLYEGVAR